MELTMSDVLSVKGIKDKSITMQGAYGSTYQYRRQSSNEVDPLATGFIVGIAVVTEDLIVHTSVAQRSGHQGIISNYNEMVEYNNEEGTGKPKCTRIGPNYVCGFITANGYFVSRRVGAIIADHYNQFNTGYEGATVLYSYCVKLKISPHVNLADHEAKLYYQ